MPGSCFCRCTLPRTMTPGSWRGGCAPSCLTWTCRPLTGFRVTPCRGAKGVADIAGWLSVRLGTEALRIVLAKVADWVARNDRLVEVTEGGDTLKLGRAAREQQEKIIDAWLARHPPGS